MGAPKLGQHSVDVLRDAGLDEAEISALSTSGAIIDGRLDNAR
jgi:crotonobetainyl-CoA:carnitine CoA-transferase CaiB-like acyl-CoA transferase